MRALSLTQPWATLIAIGAKTVETRSWSTPREQWGERIAIHAAKNLRPVGGLGGLFDLISSEPFEEVLCRAFAAPADDVTRRLPLGLVVATATLYSVVPVERAEATIKTDPGRFGEHELEFGDYSPGRWAMALRDVRALAEPLVLTGSLGLFRMPDHVTTSLAKIEAGQLELAGPTN